MIARTDDEGLSQTSEVLIDSNLLLLLIMGSFDQSLIGNFKRLAMFTHEDFSLLQSLVARKTILVTPHILTEVSNLANSLHHRHKADWSEYFKDWILVALRERQIHARDLAAEDAFLLFGITDAALFHTSSSVPILTVDARLAAFMQQHGRHAINVNHLRTWPAL
jgi:hypothetical protein